MDPLFCCPQLFLTFGMRFEGRPSPPFSGRANGAPNLDDVTEGLTSVSIQEAPSSKPKDHWR